MTPLPLLALLVGCIPAPDQGIAVGNPTVLSLQLANGEGVDFASATGTASMVWLSSPTEAYTLANNTTFNLISDASMEPPSGDWTALTFKFPGGVTLATAELERTLPVSSLVVTGAFSTSGSLILQLGSANWVDAATWQTASDADIAVLFESGTALYSDADNDSTLDADEEAAGAVACEECTEPPDDTGDTGDTDDAWDTGDTGADQAEVSGRTEVEAEAETGTEGEAGTETDAEAEAETEAETGTEAESASEAETATAPPADDRGHDDSDDAGDDSGGDDSGGDGSGGDDDSGGDDSGGDGDSSESGVDPS